MQEQTDVWEVSTKARGKQVTSEIEGTLYYTVTHLEANKYYKTSEQGVKSKVDVEGTYTSEIEGTLKCKSKNRDPYILLRVVCAHMVRAP